MEMDEFEELLAIEHEKWSNRTSTEIFDLLSKTFTDILTLYRFTEENSRNMLNEIHKTDKWTLQTGEAVPLTEENISLKAIKKILSDDFKPPHDNEGGLEHYFLALLNLYGRLFTSKKELSIHPATLFKAQAASMDISFSLGFMAGSLTGGKSRIKATQKANKTKQKAAKSNKEAIFHAYRELVRMERLTKKPTQDEACFEIKKYAENNPKSGIKSYSRNTIIRALQHKGVF